MPDTHDYPLAEVLGSGDLIHQARPAALFGSRIETRCGMEGNKTGRDGGTWCPECVALERAETNTHDERGGDGAAKIVAIRRRALTASTYAEWHQVGRDVETLIEQLAAATARAEKAERASRLLVVGQNELDRQWAETDAATRAEFEAAMNELRERAKKAESRSAALDHSGVEYRWILADGRESELELHNEGPCGCRREQRPVYVGDWRPAPAATSANWTDYGDGWSSRRPDASLDGLRGPFTGLLGPLGIAADTAPSGRSRYGLVPPRPTSDMILTPDEWCRAYGVTVHDPDGWRGKNDPAWDDPITLAEFSLRANRSTIDAANPAWDGVARDVRLCASESASELAETEKP